MEYSLAQLLYILSVRVVLTILLTAVNSLAADGQTNSPAKPKLSCQQLDEAWVIHNGAKVINPPFGMGSNQLCQQIIAQTKNNIVCNWNGQAFQFFNTKTGKALGTDDNPGDYWSSADLCLRDLQLQPENSPLHCDWNGNFFAPVTADNIQLSGKQSGWKTMKDCVKDSLSTYHAGTVCGWDSGYYLYDSQGNKILPGFGQNEDECKNFQNLMRQLGAGKKLYQSLVDKDKVTSERFKNSKADISKTSRLEKCQVPEHRYHLTKSKEGYIVPECTPDTVYSWGNWIKTAWFIQNLPANGQWKTFPRSLFTTSSAAASFGYGPVPLRFKLKPNLKFKLFVNKNAGTCDDYVKVGLVKTSEFDDTVFARLQLRNDGSSFLEYIICSGAVLDSWSLFRPEHYDEISLDYEVMTTQHFYKWEGYYKENGQDVFLNSSLDNTLGTDYAPQTYINRMHFIKTFSKFGFGKVFFQGSPPEGKSKNDADHFSTSKGTHFNPQ